MRVHKIVRDPFHTYSLIKLCACRSPCPTSSRNKALLLDNAPANEPSPENHSSSAATHKGTSSWHPCTTMFTNPVAQISHRNVLYTALMRDGLLMRRRFLVVAASIVEVPLPFSTSRDASFFASAWASFITSSRRRNKSNSCFQYLSKRSLRE